MAHPYTPAFVAFVGGAPVEEIAEEFKIPVNSLKAKIRQEGWRSLANRLADSGRVEITLNEQALNKCEANREKNLEIAVKLRDDLETIVKHLRAGTLRIKKLFKFKGSVIEHEAEPSIQDRLTIAQYATMIFNMTYRALGDTVGMGGYRADTGAGNAPLPPLTVILPAAVAFPRGDRAPIPNGLPGQAIGSSR